MVNIKQFSFFIFLFLFLFIFFFIYFNIETPKEEVLFLENETVTYKSIQGFFDKQLLDELSDFYKGQTFSDYFIIAESKYFVGKSTGDSDLKCDSLNYYIKAKENFENKTLLKEIIFFVSKECDKDTEYLEEFLLNFDVKSKREIYNSIINGEKFRFEEYSIKKSEVDIPDDFSKIILGKSYISISNQTVIGSQVDRVSRDWLSKNIYFNPTSSENIIPYFEGAALKSLKKGLNPEVEILTSTLILNNGGRWFAPDENGVFRFEVLPDKANYPTNKCFGNICLVIDTHGVSALVSEAIENNVDLVIACGDYYDKVNAAQYLAAKGIDVFMPTDRFIGESINYMGEGVIIGGGPIRNNVVGNQPIEILKDELIIVQDNNQRYPFQYYDAPKIYFSNLNKLVDLNLFFVLTSGDQTNVVVDTARKLNSNVIAVRVWSEKDYISVRDWLSENKKNRAVLFHSLPYLHAQKLFDEFTKQTSFGDARPIFK